MSVDPSVPRDPKLDAGEEGKEDSGDPDKVITSARAATSSDGLLSLAELSDFFACIPKLRSAYDVGLAGVKDLGDTQIFGSRVAVKSDRKGRHEPEYTSYTHFWKTTLGLSLSALLNRLIFETFLLDYIFVLDPVDRQSSVAALLSPHKLKDLKRGLPQKGVSSSDHISLAAEFRWPKGQGD